MAVPEYGLAGRVESNRQPRMAKGHRKSATSTTILSERLEPVTVSLADSKQTGKPPDVDRLCAGGNGQKAATNDIPGA